MFDAGKRISELIALNKTSITALANKAGLAQSTLSYIISGKNSPTVDTIIKVCAAFNITVQEFFNVGAQDPAILPPDIWALATKKENLHILRKFIELQLKGISEEIINEWLHSLDRTITALKKQYDHPQNEDTIGWVAEEEGGKYRSKLTEEEKQRAIEKFKAKLDSQDITLK